MSGQARTPEPGVTDEAVRRYREEMDSEYRPVFDRLHRLIVAMCPDAEVVLSYGCRHTGSGAVVSTSGFGSMGCRCTYRQAGTAASRRVIPSWPRERGPSSSGLQMPRASQTQSSRI